VLNNFRNLQSLFWSQGARWLLFRLGYALRKRTGLIRAQMPMYQWTDRPLETWLKSRIPSDSAAYAQWRRQNSPKFFTAFRAERSDEPSSRHAVEAQAPGNLPWNPQAAISEAERILKGELKYFAHKFIKTGFPPDWHKDPVSGKKLDPNQHWSEISDDDNIDIKFIWEASRFSMVYPLVRAYASSRDEKFAEAFWTLIESWAESNPPNTGPNWMDGQEAALRLMAWMFGFYAFLNSPSTTPEHIAEFTVLVAAHAERIYQNIEYAISTHSNHTISEAFGLWLVGLLFPELKDAEKYRDIGRRLLEQEAAAQIFPDGTYSMYSLNYHRFVLHIYLCVIRLGELNQSPVPRLIHERASASINFLSQLIDPKTGQMPVYGSNDGALVLPLNNCDFTDYRPLLQLGLYTAKKQFLFEPGPWDEDIFWLYGDQAISHAVYDASETGVREDIPSSFPQGGIYLLQSTDSRAVIRCANFRSRPSHADQLHVDLWWRGVNIACDAGTYLYSGEGAWRNGLAHTSVHNAVTVDGQDQMKMLTRFTWTNWARGKVLQHDANTWQGEHDGYQRLADPVSHKRTVLSLEGDRWLVIDHLDGVKTHHYALHWLLNDFPYEPGENSILLSLESAKCKVQAGVVDGKSVFSIVRGDPDSTRGWRSQYYADKGPAISVLLETDQPRVCFWTYFGFAHDVIEAATTELNIRFDDRETLISLKQIGHASGT
jgi:asparagine synthase (glutamine-hydrolysing)